GMVKLRLLKSLTQTADRHAIATELAARTSSTLVHVVGSIVILAKKPGREHSAFAKRRVSR
ncbi:MAG TPA: hypothetical protein VJK52_01005, partial [Candidatus Nanoarchaeia archaeon]|nr:hypothetical protein [Candidatus Nanoarchaeia archaeon]